MSSAFHVATTTFFKLLNTAPSKIPYMKISGLDTKSSVYLIVVRKLLEILLYGSLKGDIE